MPLGDIPLVAKFNNALGLNTTHIANAYSKSHQEYLVAIFHTTEWTMEKFRMDIDIFCKLPGVKAEVEWKERRDDSMVRIPYREYCTKQRKQDWEKLSVITHTGEVLVKNFDIHADRSFIINRTGKIILQKYGANVWEDHEGYNHYPK